MRAYLARPAETLLAPQERAERARCATGEFTVTVTPGRTVHW